MGKYLVTQTTRGNNKTHEHTEEFDLAASAVQAILASIGVLVAFGYTPLGIIDRENLMTSGIKLVHPTKGKAELTFTENR